MANVLDLPKEKQELLAKRRGLSHGEWLKVMTKALNEGGQLGKELDANKGVKPAGWTDEDTERLQRKISSATQ